MAEGQRDEAEWEEIINGCFLGSKSDRLRKGP